MSNKECLKLKEENKAKYAVAYKGGNISAVNEINKEILNSLKDMDKIPKCHLDKENKLIMTHSLGNSKIGVDTLCISVASGLNCPMGLTGNCSNCNICYAVNQNKMYFKNTVPKNLINQTIINKVLLGQATVHQVAFNLIHDIICSYTKKELDNIKYLRIDVEGDILNNAVLFVVDEIAGLVKTAFNLISCYSYTHNKELELTAVKNIVFNTSDFKFAGVKACNTIFKLTPDLVEKILNRDVILCNGNCNNCSYCKNQADKRDIYFLAHGGQFAGLEQVNEYILAYLDYYKKIDYVEFLAGATC